MWEEESVRTDSAYELDLGHIEFKRPGKHPRGNFDRHLDVWIREVGMEIIFRRYWLKDSKSSFERGKNMD